ncbi:MAG: UDP-N-acetylglucosamine 2-epimerase (hydrolyzing) [Thiomicrospira sp.]|uniref:UDP-N-acetylglucosamine 2-epimerase n=1 Tax=Thiomicrospira sp. TaxID=935 RepID=UPI0019FDBECF|nr:UDP-N-acetylglucosamine 2-epimerase [Thiomicrospira sp.]MBE0494058.1 UDP-N-acetylglucosamine 2-epimerase (hydrolyzing) [Thiomicrospira sp.]
MLNSHNARKIAVATGSRAEYGLLSGLMRAIQDQDGMRLQVIACAAHLSVRHGMTVNQIIEDGFKVDARIETLDESDDPVAIAKSVGRGVMGFADTLSELKPDILVVLGDRYEMLAAAQAALLLNIPIAHIHGGEVTEGAVDEAIRHAITKMASLHFTAANAYRDRVIQMGEQPKRVFNVGAPGLDLIRKLKLRDKNQLQAELGISLNAPIFLVTYHPVTWGRSLGDEAIQALFSALESFPNANIIWTAPNADAGGQSFYMLIESWSGSTSLNVQVFTNLGSVRYLSLMAIADVVIGNSSSGIIEAPAMGTPSVNIGSRQQGRLRSVSILDCDESETAIYQAIHQALTPEFQKLAAQKNSVYGQGDSVKKMLEVLSSVELKDLNTKAFYDLVDKPSITSSKDRL